MKTVTHPLPIEYLGDPQDEDAPRRLLRLYANWKAYVEGLPEAEGLSEAKALVAKLKVWNEAE